MLKINDTIKDKLETTFKIAYIVHLLLAFNGLINTTPVIKVSLAITVLLGAVVGIIKLLDYKKYVKNKNFWILNFFICSYILSMVLNVKYGFMDGAQGLIWLAAEVWILYLCDSKKDLKKEFSLLANVIIAVVTIYNSISFGMFLIGYSVKMLIDDRMRFIGFHWGRLWGVYNDPNHGAIIASLVVLLALYFCITKSEKRKRYVFSIVMQVMYIFLSDSRTGILCLGIGTALVFALVYLKKKFTEIKAKNVFVSLGVFVSIIVAILLIKEPVQIVMGEISTYTAGIYVDMITDGTGEKQEIEVGREEEEVSSDPSNRRFEIWKSGFELFSTKPITGISWSNIVSYAEQELPDTYLVNNDLQNFSSCHNMFIDVLVGQGLLGVILLLGLVVNSLIYMIKSLKNIQEQDMILTIVLFAILIISVFASMLISSILYVNSPESYIFWMSFGYIMLLLKNGNEKGKLI